MTEPTVKEAFAEQLKESVPEDFLYYYVALADDSLLSNMKLFACNSLADIETNYNLRDAYCSWPYPILTPKQSPNLFPHIDSQRTTYSLEEQMEHFRSQTKQQLVYYLEYVFFESSTDFMVTYGMPTREDVKCWMTAIDERSDLSYEDKKELNTTCQEYLHGSG